MWFARQELLLDMPEIRHSLRALAIRSARNGEAILADDQAVLDFLRVRFTRVDEGLAKIDHRLNELTGRMGRLERLVADVHVELAEHSVRLDRLSSDVERINRRFDLVEAT